jgi:hypothetical protein
MRLFKLYLARLRVFAVHCGHAVPPRTWPHQKIVAMRHRRIAGGQKKGR